MAIFDKIAKTAGNAKTKVTNFAEEKKLGEKFSDVKESMKNVFTGNKTETAVSAEVERVISIFAGYTVGKPFIPIFRMTSLRKR